MTVAASNGPSRLRLPVSKVALRADRKEVLKSLVRIALFELKFVLEVETDLVEVARLLAC